MVAAIRRRGKDGKGHTGAGKGIDTAMTGIDMIRVEMAITAGEKHQVRLQPCIAKLLALPPLYLGWPQPYACLPARISARLFQK